MAKVSEIVKEEFDDFTKEGMVLVDFFANWCMPCIAMEPVINELSEKFKGKIKFAKINIDENRELADKFEIRSIPNFILFKEGKQVEQFVGSMSAEDFESKLRNFV